MREDFLRMQERLRESENENGTLRRESAFLASRTEEDVLKL